MKFELISYINTCLNTSGWGCLHHCAYSEMCTLLYDYGVTFFEGYGTELNGKKVDEVYAHFTYIQYAEGEI